MRYRIGDELILKVADDHHGATYRSEKVRIIGFNAECEDQSAEYLVYVPPYSHIKDSFTLSAADARWYNVDTRFIGDDVAFIRARHPLYKHIPAPQGETCGRCGEFFEWAERTEEGPFMCRACKFDPYR